MTPDEGHPPAPGRTALTWMLVITTAGLALVAVALGIRLHGLRAENATLETERELAEVAGRTAQMQLTERSLLAETMINELGRQVRAKNDISRLQVVALFSPAGNALGISGVVVWDQAGQSGLFAAMSLPANGRDSEYQLWMLDSGSNEKVKGCSFDFVPGAKVVLPFKPDRPSIRPASFVVTLEKKGGSGAIQGPTMLAGTP